MCAGCGPVVESLYPRIAKSVSGNRCQKGKAKSRWDRCANTRPESRSLPQMSRSGIHIVMKLLVSSGVMRRSECQFVSDMPGFFKNRQSCIQAVAVPHVHVWHTARDIHKQKCTPREHIAQGRTYRDGLSAGRKEHHRLPTSKFCGLQPGFPMQGLRAKLRLAQVTGPGVLHPQFCKSMCASHHVDRPGCAPMHTATNARRCR